MNIKINILLIIIFPPVLALSQNRWNINFGIPNDDNYLFNKMVDYDEGLLINWRFELDENTKISKLEKNGNEIWRKTILNNDYIAYLNIVLSDNQQLIIGGSTNDFPFLISLDKCMNINWCSRFVNTQLFDHGHFVDAVFLANGDVLAMAYLEPSEQNWNQTDRIYLFYYDSNGELLWYNLYASSENYPLMDTPIPMYLTKFDNYFIISGYCWYPYPDNPDLMGLRPLFIRIDSVFNEKWALPYGVGDGVLGMASGVIEDENTNENIAVGRYAGLSGTFSVTPIMQFDSLGNETNMFLILNDSIGPTIQSNSSVDIKKVNDSNFILYSSFGINSYGNPLGELLLDTSFKVLSSQSHDNTDINFTRIDKLPNNKFMFGVNIYENPPSNYSRDILLYKLNADLSQTAIDTTAHVYDSLCDHPIASDTIYIGGCDVITGINEVPGPGEYYSMLKTIPIKISPNPAKNAIAFEFENAAYHKNIILSCYNLEGELVFEQTLKNGESAIVTSVSNWHKGMYIAIAYSDDGGSGSGKFVVYR